MIAFIDDHRSAYGIEPICKVLPIAPSTYHAHVALRREPEQASARAQRDALLKAEIRRVFAENFGVYGVRKVWHQRRRLRVRRRPLHHCPPDAGNGRSSPRFLRWQHRWNGCGGMAGVICGMPVRTTVSNRAAPCPLDRVNRQFCTSAPKTL